MIVLLMSNRTIGSSDLKKNDFSPVPGPAEEVNVLTSH